MVLGSKGNYSFSQNHGLVVNALINLKVTTIGVIIEGRVDVERYRSSWAVHTTMLANFGK